MKRNNVNIIYGVILGGLLLYFVYLMNVIYPQLVGSNFFVCDSCLSFVLPFIQKIMFSLAVLAFGNLIINTVKTLRFKNSLFPVCPRPKFIKSLAEKYLLQDKIIIFDNSRLMAFCLGVLNPKIYLSNQLLKSMSHSEIEAIILHEKQHILGKDNLLLLFLNLIKTAFFFFPIIGDFVNSIEIQKEIIADKVVVEETGRRINIISALRKVIESKPSFMYATAFSEDLSIEPRIRSLVGKKNRLLSIKYSSVIISLSVLLFLVNITLNRIEIHPQTNSSTMLCLDKGTCSNICQ